MVGKAGFKNDPWQRSVIGAGVGEHVPDHVDSESTWRMCCRRAGKTGGWDVQEDVAQLREQMIDG